MIEGLEGKLYISFTKLIDADQNKLKFISGLSKEILIDADVNENKLKFISALSKEIPTADPTITTIDGKNIDIFWEDQLVITLTDEETVAVSNNEHKIYKYFEKMDEEAIEFIKEQYNIISK